jgi:hypothetical protein
MSERQFDDGEADHPAGDLAGDPAASRRPRIGASPTDDPDRIVAQLTERARVRAAAVTAETAALVDAVAALRPFEGRFGMTWRKWVEWQLGLTTAEARRICCLAEKLPSLPAIDAAFRSGELSEGVTEVLARVATPANEAEVIAVAAKVATGAQLQQVARDYRQVRDAATKEGGEKPDPAEVPSEASWGWDDRGRFRGSWNLRPDDGATVEAALEAALAHLRPTEADIDRGRTAASGHPRPAGGAADIAEGTLRPGERVAARHSDALVAMAEDALAGDADDGLLPESTQVIVHHNIGSRGHASPDGQVRIPGISDLHARAGSPDGTSEDTDTDADARSRAPELDDATHSLAGSTIPGCGSVPHWLAAKLACGSLCITVEMIAGFPVSEPTAVRPFNRGQRRALRARDRHCRFPGCRRTRHLHAHHTKPWHPTKRTSVADAVLLCNQHHTLVHLKGYTIALGVDHVTTVTRPDGTVLRSVALPPPDPCSRTRAHPDDPPPDRRNTGTGEPLTHYARDTLATSWHLADVAAADGQDPPDGPDPSGDPDPPGGDP